MPFKTSAPSAPLGFRWSASFREAGLLVLFALAATTISWFLRSDSLPLAADPVVYELELAAPLAVVEDALALYDEGDFLFVDTRPPADGEFQTIPGAFFIREASFDKDLIEYFEFMTTEDHFILFGDGSLFTESNIAARMMDRGYKNLFILKGGLPDWRRAGGDISHRTGAES